MKSKSYFRLVSLVLSIVMLSLCAISSSAFSENSHDFLEDKCEFENHDFISGYCPS